MSDAVRPLSDAEKRPNEPEPVHRALTERDRLMWEQWLMNAYYAHDSLEMVRLIRLLFNKLEK